MKCHCVYVTHTCTFMEGESTALVHIEVDGVGGSVGYVVDVVAAHMRVVVSDREGVGQVRLSS